MVPIGTVGSIQRYRTVPHHRPGGNVMGKKEPLDSAMATDCQAVRLNTVAKTYRSGAVDVAALKGISLNIPYHRFSVVIGASGSGKTALLNIIGGIDSPTGGTVEVCGQNLGE